MNYLPGLALNWDPPELGLPSRCKPLAPSNSSAECVCVCVCVCVLLSADKVISNLV
jgi:hypothetical protein